jgi:hypothetical protein
MKASANRIRADRSGEVQDLGRNLGFVRSIRIAWALFPSTAPRIEFLAVIPMALRWPAGPFFFFFPLPTPPQLRLLHPSDKLLRCLEGEYESTGNPRGGFLLCKFLSIRAHDLSWDFDRTGKDMGACFRAQSSPGLEDRSEILTIGPGGPARGSPGLSLSRP